MVHQVTIYRVRYWFRGKSHLLSPKFRTKAQAQKEREDFISKHPKMKVRVIKTTEVRK